MTAAVTAVVVVALLVLGGVLSWVLGPDTRHPDYALRRPDSSGRGGDTPESRFP